MSERLVRVKNSMVSYQTFCNFRFNPGVNEVPEGKWKEIIEQPIVRDHFIKLGMLKEMGVSAETQKVKIESLSEREGQIENLEVETSGLSELSAEKAKIMIADTFDLKLLRAWKETETRKQVLKAIEEKMNELLGDNESE